MTILTVAATARGTALIAVRAVRKCRSYGKYRKYREQQQSSIEHETIDGQSHRIISPIF
jgi:hypothetical protein